MAVKREQVVQTAEKYVARGKIEPAIREYRKLLEENPNDINTLNRVGDLYARIQRIDEAVDFFNQIAEQYAGEGFFVKAIAIYKKIIKLDPTRLDVYENLAELYHRQGLVTEARTQYQVLADYYQKHENATSTIAIYQKMAELEPNNPTYHVKLAELYQQQKLIEKAMGEYRIIAELMIEHGHPQEAAQVYERALAIDSTNIGFITDAALKLKEAAGSGIAARFLAAAVERNPQAAQVARLIGGQAGLAAATGGTHAGTRPADIAAHDAADLAHPPVAATERPPAGRGAAAQPAADDAAAHDAAAAAGQEPPAASGALPGEAAGSERRAAAAAAGWSGAETARPMPFEPDMEMEIEIDLGADLILGEDLEPPPPAGGLPAAGRAAAPGFEEPGEAGQGYEAAFEIDEELAPEAAAGGRSPLREPPPALADEETGLDDVFVLDIEDDEEPASLVKPPPDMLQQPGRPSWAQKPPRGAAPAPISSSPAATAPPAPGGGSRPAQGAGRQAAGRPGELPDLLDLPELPEIPDFPPLPEMPAIDGQELLFPFPPPAPGAGPGPRPAPGAGPGPTVEPVEAGERQPMALPDARWTGAPPPPAAGQALAPPLAAGRTGGGPSGDAGDLDMTPAALGAAPHGAEQAAAPAGSGQEPPLLDIDSDLLERTAAEIHPPAIERYEDLVSEAEVLAKYGLEEKAIERLRDAARLRPRQLAAHLLLLQLHLDKGRHGRVIELGNQISRLTVESGDRDTWPKLRKRLLTAGYRVDGDRVVAAPLPAGVMEGEASPRPGRAGAPGPAAGREPLPGGPSDAPLERTGAGAPAAASPPAEPEGAVAEPGRVAPTATEQPWAMPPLPAPPAAGAALDAAAAPAAGGAYRPEALPALGAAPSAGAAPPIDLAAPVGAETAAAAGAVPPAAAQPAPPAVSLGGATAAPAPPTVPAAAGAVPAPVAPRRGRRRSDSGIAKILDDLVDQQGRPGRGAKKAAASPPPAVAPPAASPAGPPPLSAAPPKTGLEPPAPPPAFAAGAVAPSGREPGAPPEPGVAAGAAGELLGPPAAGLDDGELATAAELEALAAAAAPAEDFIELPPLIEVGSEMEAPAEAPSLEIFNPLEIGAMVESEEIDWDDDGKWPGYRAAQGAASPLPAGGGAPPGAAASAAGAAADAAHAGAAGSPVPRGGPAAPGARSRPPARPLPPPPSAPSAAAAAALDDTGMSWLDEADSGKDKTAAQAASLFDEEEDFFDLAGELEQELSQEAVFQGSDLLMPQEQSLEEIVEGFKRGVAEHLSPTDYDTHFNLGIAYREMGLLDEAIGEFQLSAKDSRYLVSCCSMLGLCFLDKGLPELAIKWYRRGLEAPEIGEEDTLGLLYDMGCAYLTMGDNDGAYKTFVDAYGINTNYRDVVARIEELGHPH